jgi:hypothetical protein
MIIYYGKYFGIKNGDWGLGIGDWTPKLKIIFLILFYFLNYFLK